MQLTKLLLDTKQYMINQPIKIRNKLMKAKTREIQRKTEIVLLFLKGDFLIISQGQNRSSGLKIGEFEVWMKN
ncbi:hypothetical protein SC09_contig8orf00253 [Bacillus subtilis]|uniref:Uncharacterized protein n=1 Tax=Bacillus subtilis TaxID=1423 RepID=A0A0D1K8W9_BACIU|nr:hypothetical protein SC09_contig8orf00253 [Bacillus subtilis]